MMKSGDNIYKSHPNFEIDRVSEEGGISVRYFLGMLKTIILIEEIALKIS